MNKKSLNVFLLLGLLGLQEKKPSKPVPAVKPEPSRGFFEVQVPPPPPEKAFRQLGWVYRIKKKYLRPGKHNRLLLKKLRAEA